MNKFSLLFIIISLIICTTSCKKEEMLYEPAAFELICNDCTITYSNDGSSSSQLVKNSLKIHLKPNSNANISIIAKGNTIFRFFLTNEEVYFATVTGTKVFSYDYKSNTLNDGTTSKHFGSPKNNSNNKTSSKCGARTKTGGSCQRSVKGGGYCWQHK